MRQISAHCGLVSLSRAGDVVVVVAVVSGGQISVNLKNGRAQRETKAARTQSYREALQNRPHESSSSNFSLP